MTQLYRLVNEGDTIVVVKHDMDVITQSDWVIDIGPEAGGKGGKIVTLGTPQQVAAHPVSKTAYYLKKAGIG